MSTHLYYRLPADEHMLANGLKNAVNGNLFDWGSGWHVLDSKNIDFFKGVAAATDSEEVKKDAEKIIELIETNGCIELCLR